MNPSHPLTQLVPNRIRATLARLERRIWTQPVPLLVEGTPAKPSQRGWADARGEGMRKVRFGSAWGKLFDQRWCRIRLDQPSVAGDWLHWQEQGEATLYLEGVPYFGFDVAHRRCRLPEGARELWVECNAIQSAIWHPDASGLTAEGCHFVGAWLCRRDDEAWGAYHDLDCLFQLAMDMRQREEPVRGRHLKAVGQQLPMECCPPEFRILWRVMEEAADALDGAGVAAMRRVLKEGYAGLRTEKVFQACVLTGHAHVDLVWMWPERMGELKAVHSFATVNRLMDEYPEFRFAYSQPASYEAVARRSPQLFDAVRDRIKRGQWEATGAMYVESDTLIATGEALAQSFVLGQKWFSEHCGRPSSLTWLPDVFGYSACLPQLMKLSGVDRFFTTKMTWNEISRFPHSSFRWRGSDGSEVLAHVTQDSGYNTNVTVGEIKAPMYGNQQAHLHPEYLLPSGFGDGGGGPTHDMCERARRLGALPGMPEVEWGHPEAFFERLETVRETLPVHHGECYLECHRGTFTTHGDLKAVFRRLERSLHAAEAALAVTGATADLEPYWKRMVFAQFHDFIPGSSVWDVCREGLSELKRLADEVDDLTKSTLESTQGEPVWFNPHAVACRGWVKEAGLKRAVYVQLPPLSVLTLEEARAEAPEAPVLSGRGRSVSNGLVAFSLDTNGWIKALTFEGVTVPQREPLGKLVVYPDHPANYEAWDIDRHVLRMGEDCRAKPTIEAFEDEGVEAGFRVKRRVGDHSEATVTYALKGGCPLVHVTVDLDWQDPDRLLKLWWPTRYAGTHARFGTPFGSVLRPQISQSLAAEAMWEVPFSRYLAVFDEGEAEGLFCISEAKYGASVRDGAIGISLVRSAIVTGMKGGYGSAWSKDLSRLKDLSCHSDLGTHTIRLAVGRYDTRLPVERQPATLAETVFSPPVTSFGKSLVAPLIRIHSGETLVPCWTKPLVERGAFLLRFHEVGGRRGSLSLDLAKGYRFVACDLKGTPLPEAGGRTIGYRPYEIVSIRIESVD